MGARGGTQMLVEHDHRGGEVGRVLSSWEGPDGSLRVSGTIEDPSAVNAVRNGSMRQLSLGTSVHSTDDGKVLMRTHDELSICEQAARAGCMITDINGKQVASTRQFSRKGEFR